MGVPGVGGQNKRTLLDHLERGTYQRSRVDGYRKPAAPSTKWRPSRADLAHLSAAGRRLVHEWIAEFHIDGAEARVLLLAARLEDQLDAVRQVDRVPLAPAALSALERKERAVIKLQADLFKQLRVVKA